MNKKGQALVEFVIILPVLLLIIVSIIDFGNIIYNKYKLENNIDDIIIYYKENDTLKLTEYLKKNNIKINYQKEDKYTTIKLEKNIKITSLAITPFVGNKYVVTTEKTILEKTDE